MNPYTLILAAILIISPLAIGLAQKQDKGTKSRLKNIFLLILVSQLILSLLSWKILSLFLIISLIQIFLLTREISHQIPVVILNFINTFVFWAIMIRLDQKQIGDPTNLADITITFIVLIGNVIGLLLINKDKKLMLPKSLFRRGKLTFSILLILTMTAIIGFSFWNKGARNTAIAKVSALPEVAEYLRDVPSGRVVIDHEDSATNSYLIHVFEVVDDHTATFNWYTVDKTTGAITKDF